MRRAGLVILIMLMVLLVLWQTGGISYFLSRTIFRPDFVDDDNGQSAEPEPDLSNGQFSVAELSYQVVVLSEGLSIPWDLAFLPDGRILVTERAGKVIVLPERQTVLELDAALPIGEGGLLGIALDPDFEENRYVLLYYTYRSGTRILNRVSRFEYSGDSLLNEKVLIEAIPGAGIHNGGRIRFGPDGMLYVCTGDAAEPNRSQDPQDLAGKILRYQPDGSIPADNPDPSSPVYSLGHRNPQGLAWHPTTGDLYASEHGPTRQDEINRIQPGLNYGWPEVTCSQGHGQYQEPIACYADFTLAPSGMDFLAMEDMFEVSLFVAGLRGNMVRRLDFSPNGELLREETMFSEWGRIRSVHYHHGSLYILTNNGDGRGIPQPNDDRLIRVTPTIPSDPGSS